MQDEGRSIKEATEELCAKHPEWKEYIEAYYGRWIEMLGGAIEETVERKQGCINSMRSQTGVRKRFRTH